MKKSIVMALATAGLIFCLSYTNTISLPQTTASLYKVTTADKAFTGRADISLFTEKADIGQADVGVN